MQRIKALCYRLYLVAPWLIKHSARIQWRHKRGVKGLTVGRRMRCKPLREKAQNCGGASCVAQ
jgi:hypothetical protein